MVLTSPGRGTQNYTCDTANPTSTPTAVGAVANLYDAGCIASKYNFLASFMPTIALQFPQPKSDSGDDLLGMNLLGHHYFKDPKTPYFDLGSNGHVTPIPGTKVAAPKGAPAGQNGQGDGAVPWLCLSPKADAQSQNSFQDVFRVNVSTLRGIVLRVGQPC